MYEYSTVPYCTRSEGDDALHGQEAVRVRVRYCSLRVLYLMGHAGSGLGALEVRMLHRSATSTLLLYSSD